MPLTAQEVALVQASFGKLAGCWTSIAENFFVRAFKKYPGIQAAFVNALDGETEPESIRGSKKLQAHSANFKGGLTALINNLGDSELLGIMMYKLAINHVRRQLDPARFEEAFDEFVLMLSEDPSNNKATINAWNKAFGVIASLMTSCMAEIRSNQ